MINVENKEHSYISFQDETKYEVAKVKEVYTEAKKSKNFQTYTVGRTIEIPGHYSDEEVDLVVSTNQAKCRKDVVAQILIDQSK